MKKKKINEIFYSLQGEGVHTGTPAVFVRFSGCNLRCPFCDTQHEEGAWMTNEEITTEVKRYSPRFVILTGGEPSLQIDGDLIQRLHDDGHYICIETNGTHPLPPGIDWVTCSPKENAPVVLEKIDEVKLVYTGQDVESFYRQLKAGCYSLQPCSGQNIAETVAYVLAHPWWRLSLQTHKLIDIR